MKKWNVLSIGLIFWMIFQVGCENSQSRRQPIKGRTSRDVVAMKGLDKLEGKCPIQALSKAIGKLEKTVVRYHTRSVKVVANNTDLSNLEYSNDKKLVAQVLNGSNDVRLQVKAELGKDAFKKFDVLNVVSQEACSKVKVTDEKGTMLEYSILSGDKGKTRLILKQSANQDIVKVVTILQGSILIRTIQKLASSSLCGNKAELLVEETVEISAAEKANSGTAIDIGLAEILAEYTEGSDNLRGQLVKGKEPRKTDAAKERNPHRGYLPRVELPVEVLIEAYSKAQKGQFKNVGCDSPASQAAQK